MATARQNNFAQYITELLHAAESESRTFQFHIIDVLADLYQQQRRRRTSSGPVKVERVLYDLLTDRGHSAAFHQMILLAFARFEQLDGSNAPATSAGAFTSLPTETADPEQGRALPLFARRTKTSDATVRHLLPTAAALQSEAEGLYDNTLKRWEARGGDVEHIANELRKALLVQEGIRDDQRRWRRVAGAFGWVILLLAPFFLTMALCANLYTDHLLIFLRQTVF